MNVFVIGVRSGSESSWVQPNGVNWTSYRTSARVDGRSNGRHRGLSTERMPIRTLLLVDFALRERHSDRPTERIRRGCGV